MQINSTDDLITWIIHQIANHLPNQAILKGGMLFRLLNSPRHTNDIDYTIIPYTSKKEVWPKLKAALTQNDSIKLEHSYHSKMLRILVQYNDLKVQVEVDVSEKCLSESMSTSPLVSKANQLPQIIKVMRYDVALAHKLAAWNERNLLRDLYDAYFLKTHLNTMPHNPTLLNRLKHVQPAKKNTKPTSMSLDAFLIKLKTSLNELTATKINKELSALIPANELKGLDKRLKATLSDMIVKLKSDEL